MTAERFTVKNIMFDGDCIVDTTDDGYYTTDKQDLENLCEVLNELADENKQLKKALWCIRKRYGYTVEEFIEDLKDNGIDLTKVNLE